MMSVPSATPAARSVLICDDRPIARRLLVGLLSPERSTAVADGVAAADAYAATPADVVFVGIHRGSRSGLDALTLLSGRHAASVIAFGSLADSSLLVDATHGGACGLMIWDPIQQSSSRRCSSITRGEGGTTDPQSSEPDPADGLTEREYLILHAMSRGQSNAAIGRDLELAEDTIKNHARQLFGKLGARDRAHAVAIGLRSGLLR